MTLAQTIYGIAVVVYACFFLLFCRFFLWKRYAEGRYWLRRPQLDLKTLQQRAHESGKDIPFLTLVVPARDEALVIRRTVEHMLRLRYPPGRWQLLVVTDEKERLARHEHVDQLVARVMTRLEGKGRWTQEEFHLLVAQFSLLLKEEQETSAFRSEELVRDLAWELVRTRGRVSSHRMERIAKCYLPAAARRVNLLRPQVLALAVARAALVYCDEEKAWSALWRRQRRHFPMGHANLYCQRTGDRLLQTLAVLAPGEGKELLLRAARSLHSTTQEAVERSRQAMGEEVPLKVIEVPWDFDGQYGGERTGHAVVSTKGRALNYALSFLHPQTEVIGFYDAESRPHPEVLLYAAYRRLEPSPPRILQGPVFQVRNFFALHPVCRIASLYQAVAHEWYLPVLFRRLPFVGGTNLFVDAALLRSLGGFASDSLTEDLELGVRAYLEAGVWPDYLPYHSSEQTPETVRAFMRQRLRWGSGHLDVVDKIKRPPYSGYPGQRRLLRQLYLKGQLEWVLYQGATLVPPTLIILWTRGLVDGSWLPLGGRILLHTFTIVYFAFTFYALKRYAVYFESGTAPPTFLGRLAVTLQILLLPLAAFLFPLPYSSALVLKQVGRGPKAWTKTPRTRE